MTRTDEDLIADLVATTKHLGQLLQPGYGAFQLEKLLAIKRWVLASLSIQVGDRVEPRHELVNEHRSPGWVAHRDLLRPGNVGTVEAIDFNPHWQTWQCSVRFDANHDACFSIKVAWLRKVEVA